MDSLLATKFNIPTVHHKLVNRSELLTRLDTGLDKKLTLISAPAGYGKSTLAAEWLADIDQPYGWLSLAEEENDPVRFLTYLIAALQKIDPSIGQTVAGLLGAPQLPPVETLMANLINDLNSLEDKGVLVLDDYHLINNQAIQTGLQYLLEAQLTSLLIVIITREDPPFNLSRLRVNNQLTEIRAEDLRFRAAEVDSFFTETMELSLGEAAVAALTDRTEGWIAGLQLAALSLQKKEAAKVEQFIKSFSGSHRHIIDYLFEEVIKEQKQELYNFLVRTSILQRLTAPLCNAVTGREDSEQLLNLLDQANLFIIPLDEQGTVYRYHQLFADYLRTELNEAEKSKLHLKAGDWLETEGYLVEAVNHTLEADEIKQSISLIEKTADSLLQKGEIATLLDWIDNLAAEDIDNHPTLLFYKALGLFFAGRIQEAGFHLDRLKAGLAAEADQKVGGRVKVLEVLLKIISGEPDFYQLAREALELIEQTDNLFYSAALLGVGWAQASRGEIKPAIDSFNQAFFQAKQLEKPFIAVIALINLALNLIKHGERKKAEAVCRQGLEEFTTETGGELPSAKIIYVTLGMACFEANQLQQAEEYLLTGLKLLKQLGLIHLYAEVRLYLASVYYALDKKEAVREILQELYEFAQETDFAYLNRRLAAYKAEIQLKEGNIELAEDWIADNYNPEEMYNFCARETYARILLTQGEFAQALEVLEELEEIIADQEKYSNLLIIYLLESWAWKELQEKEKAVSYLKQAVAIAADEEFYFSFIEYGAPTAELLPEIESLAPTFISNLKQHFDAKTVVNEGNEQLIEPLSKRELEILDLIVQGYSNKEIAEKSFITVGTTKWHIHNIYGKLGVSRRPQAIKKAKRLELV